MQNLGLDECMLTIIVVYVAPSDPDFAYIPTRSNERYDE